MPRFPRYLLFVILLSLPSCRETVLDDLGPVGAFALTERNGVVVTDTDLRGKVWIASFVFTRCTGPCPQVSATMARLQRDLKNDADVRLVTFTVDPKQDDTKELVRYADSFQADPKRWFFLTGDEEQIHRLLHDGFHVPVEKQDGEIMHSPRLVVVDRRGHIRAYRDGMRDPNEPDPERRYEANLQQIRQDVLALLREAP